MDASRDRGRLSRILGRHPDLLRTLVLAVACNLLLELAGVLGAERHLWDYKTPAYPLMFLLGSLVVWAVVGAVHALTGRIQVTAPVMLVLTAAIAVADQQKVRLRREPLLPSDWEFATTPGFLADMVGPRLLVPVGVVLALLVVAAVVALVRAARRRGSAGRLDHGVPSLDTRWRRVTARSLTGVLCLVVLADLGSFNSHDNLARRTFDVLGADWKPWSQERNYLGNGFVGGFLYNLDVPDMAAPPGYSRAAMADIVSRWTAEAARINADRDPAALRRTNVVVVLSESFSDPLALDGLSFPQDPIPEVRQLVSESGGAMLAQSIGGGTANMEFESLTGMSMALFPPQMAVPYQMMVASQPHFPSVVEWMEREGHKTIALHPFTTEMYRRREVYRAMGFDEFVHDTTMEHRRRVERPGYISDRAAFAEVGDLIADNEQPVFMNVVTMQNHMPYVGRYHDPYPVEGPDDELMRDTRQYVRGLTYSDAAVAHFLGVLRRSPEPTVVVFYGDHLPGTYPEAVLRDNDESVLHQTPYFVWSNTSGSATTPPVMSPSHVIDLALERIGAKVPPYYALLQELRAELPAMDSGFRYDAAGQPVREGGLSPRAAQLLRDYRMVQYDLSVGNRWSEAEMLGPSPAGSR